MRPDRRLVILGGAAACLGGGAFAFWPRPASSGNLMTPVEAQEAAARGDLLLVDIRRPDEWARTGIAEHAVAIDMRRRDFLQALAAARTSDAQPVAIICAAGVRSKHMSRALREAGLTDIVDIPEGMTGSSAGPGWVARGLPVRAYTP